jgi:hypothetical protein
VKAKYDVEGTPPVVTFAWSVPISVLGHYEHARLYSKRNCPQRGNIPSSAAHDPSDGHHPTIITQLWRKTLTFSRVIICIARTVTRWRNVLCSNDIFNVSDGLDGYMYVTTSHCNQKVFREVSLLTAMFYTTAVTLMSLLKENSPAPQPRPCIRGSPERWPPQVVGLYF